jgi:hypothetical protein
MKIIENFLTEQLFFKLYGDATSQYLNWRVAEELYEEDILIRGRSYKDNSYMSAVNQHGFEVTDSKYDIQNVVMIRDYHGVRDIEINSLPSMSDVMLYFDEKLNIKIPLKMKLNMSFCGSLNRVNSFHTDVFHLENIKYETAILYLNDNDGGTLLEDGTFINSKANRCVIFDGHTKHAPVSQTNTKKRLVLNYNFIAHKTIL